MKKKACILLPIIACGISSAINAATPDVQSVVVPNASENFDRPGVGRQYFTSSDRIFLIIDSTELATKMPQGGRITGIAMRLDAEFGKSLNSTLPDIQINLGLGVPVEAPIPPNFEANIGSRYEVAFPRGMVDIKAQFTPEQVHPFDIKIPLTIPFSYHPSEGNLLIDILAFEGFRGGPPAFVDAAMNTSLRAYSDEGTLGIRRVGGPALEIQFIPIPEPSVWAILVLGSAVTFVIRRR